ncbi:MAG TPA: LysR substrate-binding domain-containing protein [Actinomycetes bacterium]|nr:LysR substrate-binding domain-containing protein [Actinomycetes bacterium]
MELRQLSYFVAVAEEAHFTRAAQRVSVAQPAVSAQIRRLERELGETLFHRDQRAVRLTVAGAALLPHAQAALAAAQRGRDTIASLRGLLHGALRIGVVRPVDHRLAETLGEFHRTHPAIDITLTELHNEPAVQALSSGDLDAALVGFHDQPLPPQISMRIVAAEPLVLAANRGHLLARRAVIAVDQLRDQPIITLTHGSGLRTVLDNACRGAGFTPRIVAETGELASLVELTTEGLGVAVLPRSAVSEADLAIIRISRPSLQRRTALAWNPTTTTPAGRAFFALADKHFPVPPAIAPTAPPH